MPLLDTKKQLGAKLEAVTGTAEAITGSDVTILLNEATATPEFETFTQDFVRSTFTGLLGQTTLKLGGMAITTNLRGTGSGTVVPGFFLLAQACSMRQVTTARLRNVTAFTVGAGPFRHRETISITSDGTGQTPGSATVLHDTHDGAAVMYVTDLQDPVMGSTATKVTLVGAESAVEAEIVQGDTWDGTYHTDNIGFTLYPFSMEEKTIELTGAWGTVPSAGDVIEGATSGALGVYVSITGTTVTFRRLEGAWQDNESIDNATTGVAGVGTVAADAAEQYLYGASATLRLFEDGAFSELSGARGNMRISFPQVNRPPLVEFAFSGIWDHGDEPLQTGTAIQSDQPPLFRNQSVFFADNQTAGQEAQAVEYNACLAALEFDIGAQLANRECQGAATGLEEVIITGRDGTGRATPERTLSAVHDWIQFFEDAVPVRLRTTVGQTVGNQFYITAPGLQYTSAAPGERNKILQHDVGFRLSGGDLVNLDGTPSLLEQTGGENELVITYVGA